MRPLPTDLGSAATLHGHSAFTTLRTRHGQALMVSEHLARLAATCAFLELPAPDPDLPTLSPLPWGLLRLTVTGEGTFWQHRPLPVPALPASGADVWLSSIQVHPQLGRHKTGNYLPYLLAKRGAEQRGAFEGLLTDGAGYVADGSRTGLLLRVHGQLVMPGGGLPSLTRAAWLAELGEVADVRSVSLDMLRQADAVWLFGAGVGAVPVGRVRAETWKQAYRAVWPDTLHPALVMPT